MYFHICTLTTHIAAGKALFIGYITVFHRFTRLRPILKNTLTNAFTLVWYDIFIFHDNTPYIWKRVVKTNVTVFCFVRLFFGKTITETTFSLFSVIYKNNEFDCTLQDPR